MFWAGVNKLMDVGRQQCRAAFKKTVHHPKWPYLHMLQGWIPHKDVQKGSLIRILAVCPPPPSLQLRETLWGPTWAADKYESLHYAKQACTVTHTKVSMQCIGHSSVVRLTLMPHRHAAKPNKSPISLLQTLIAFQSHVRHFLTEGTKARHNDRTVLSTHKLQLDLSLIRL